MSNSISRGLQTLLFCTFTLGCSQSVDNEGYCLNDNECAEGLTCDALTQRCQPQTELTIRSDAALDRVLDMEIDALIVDALVVDAMVVDAMVVDAMVVDAMVVDAMVVDADVTQDVSVDMSQQDASATDDTGVTDAIP